MLRVDHEICEHVVDDVFVIPHSSHQLGIHIPVGCVGFTSHCNRVLILYRDWRFRVKPPSLRNLIYGLCCEITLGGAGTGPILRGIGPITCSGLQLLVLRTMYR